MKFTSRLHKINMAVSSGIFFMLLGVPWSWGNPLLQGLAYYGNNDERDLRTANMLANIRSQFHTQDELGQYSYGYNDGLSSKMESRTADGVTHGSYSYVDSNGILQKVSYVADEINGFRVTSSNLPGGVHMSALPSLLVPDILMEQQQHPQLPTILDVRRSHASEKAEERKAGEIQVSHDDSIQTNIGEGENEMKNNVKSDEKTVTKEKEQDREKAKPPSIVKTHQQFQFRQPSSARMQISMQHYSPPRIYDFQQLYDRVSYQAPRVRWQAAPIVPYATNYNGYHYPLMHGMVSPIYSQYHAQDDIGQYSYGYSGDSSSKAETKTADGITRGDYAYVDPNGILQKVNYIADPIKGFQVTGTNLPVSNMPAYYSPQPAYLHELNLISTPELIPDSD